MSLENWWNNESKSKPFEKFRIEPNKYKMGKERLGRGGFGIVHKGKYESGDVALKQMDNDDSDTEKSRIIIREIEISCKIAEKSTQLNNGNLIKFYGFSITDDKENQLGLVAILELAHFKSLDRMISSNPDKLCIPFLQKFGFEDFSKIYSDINKGLSCLHNNHNIAHRDLKPENVMLVKAEKNNFGYNCKLGDFGISREIDNTTAHTKAGTELYKAPEQYDIKFTDSDGEKKGIKGKHEVDKYALGLIIYYLVFRKTPEKVEAVQKHEWFTKFFETPESDVGKRKRWEKKIKNRLLPSLSESDDIEEGTLFDEVYDEAQFKLKTIIKNCCRLERKKRMSLNDIKKEIDELKKFKTGVEGLDSYFKKMYRPEPTEHMEIDELARNVSVMSTSESGPTTGKPVAKKVKPNTSAPKSPPVSPMASHPLHTAINSQSSMQSQSSTSSKQYRTLVNEHLQKYQMNPLSKTDYNYGQHEIDGKFYCYVDYKISVDGVTQRKESDYFGSKKEAQENCAQKIYTEIQTKFGGFV